MDMKSRQERLCYPMATLKPKVLLPHRKDTVKEKDLILRGILEAHVSTLFTSCPFSACAIVNKATDRQRAWDLIPFQNLATVCASFYCTLCGRTTQAQQGFDHLTLPAGWYKKKRQPQG